MVTKEIEKAVCEPGTHFWERLWLSKNRSVWHLLPELSPSAWDYCIGCGLMRRFGAETGNWIYMGQLSARLLKELENAYDDPSAPFLPMQILS